MAYEGMTEDELIARAGAAFDRAKAAERGTIGWAVQWCAYDTVMAELDRRAIRWAASAPPEALRELRAWLAAAGLDARGKR